MDRMDHGRQPQANHQRVLLFGMPIDNLNLAEMVDYIETLIQAGGVWQYVAVNVDKVVKMQRDPQLRAAVLAGDVIGADGQPLVWASRWLNCPLKERVTGVDLFEQLIARCAQRGWRPYLLGGRADVVARTAAVLQSRHPRLRLAGWQHGHWLPAEEPAILHAIQAAQPEVLFVGISSPQKELLLARWKTQLGVPFVMGVGGSFDVVAGVTRRAPDWWRRWGLEWLFRLLQEPRRLWRRYLVEDLQFLPLLWCEWRHSRAGRPRLAKERRPGTALTGCVAPVERLAESRR